MSVAALNDDGICERCDHGAHRLCNNADCECPTGKGAHQHINRPKPGETPGPPPAQENQMPGASAPVTPIKPKAVPPKIELRKVGEIPEVVKQPKLADRVVAKLEGAILEDGQWYELITYSGRNGASGTAGRLAKDERLAGYEFAPRGNVLFVRAKADV